MRCFQKVYLRVSWSDLTSHDVFVMAKEVKRSSPICPFVLGIHVVLQWHLPQASSMESEEVLEVFPWESFPFFYIYIFLIVFFFMLLLLQTLLIYMMEWWGNQWWQLIYIYIWTKYCTIRKTIYIQERRKNVPLFILVVFLIISS